MARPHIPQQQSRAETHRGVEVNVWAYREPNGHWTWAYVAGEYQGRLRGALLPTAEAALAQGMNAARARVG